jgi:SAM-dependent methyltransferase
VRSDLRRPPLARGSLGFVSCLGVLHHLADPAAGFRGLVELLAPGGLVLIYVYSRPHAKGVRWAGLAAAEALRRVTVRLPHRVLRVLSAPIAALLYGLFTVPGRIGEDRGWNQLAALPLNVYRRKPVRTLWLDTFDRLSAPLERRYVWEEVRPWFEEGDLEVVAVREDAGLFVLGRKR